MLNGACVEPGTAAAQSATGPPMNLLALIDSGRSSSAAVALIKSSRHYLWHQKTKKKKEQRIASVFFLFLQSSKRQFSREAERQGCVIRSDMV